MVAAVFVLGFNLSALTEAQERKDKKILMVEMKRRYPREASLRSYAHTTPSLLIRRQRRTGK